MELDNDTVHMLLHPDRDHHRHGSRAYKEDGSIRYHEAYIMETIKMVVSGRATGHRLSGTRVRLWSPRDPDSMRREVRIGDHTPTKYYRLTDDLVATEG